MISFIFIILFNYALSNPVDDVNIFIGTDNNSKFSHGNVYPAITVPFSSLSVSFQTNSKIEDGWLFKHGERQLYGFRLTHQPSPWINDHNTLLIQPSTSKDFSKKSFSFKTTKPHFASLDYDKIEVGLTCSQHSTVFKFKGKGTDKLYINIKIPKGFNNLKWIGSNRIDGYVNNRNSPKDYPMYLTILTSKTIQYFDCNSNINSKNQELSCVIEIPNDVILFIPQPS